MLGPSSPPKRQSRRRVTRPVGVGPWLPTVYFQMVVERLYNASA
jgi:hypothetical protein